MFLAAKKRKKQCSLLRFLAAIKLSKSCSRPCRLMTLLTQNGTADFRLEWNLIVLTAVIADDLKAGRSIFATHYLLRAAFQATLRSGQVSLIEGFLFFFGKEKRLFTLHASGFDIRHISYLD